MKIRGTCFALPSAVCLGLSIPALGNPTGPSVTQGTASFNTSGSHLNIQASNGTFINWQSFNIGVGETTTFLQPSSSSLVWNQINGQNPSQILGNLNANGYVVLQNSSGFYIGGQAVISAHGLVMTTAPIATPDLAGGGPWAFNAPPVTASVVNYGQINLGKGGSAFLIAHNVENHGTITAPEGEIGLYAGKQVLISDRPDGRGLSAQVSLPDGSVDNSGKLVANAGSISMNASVVNQGGLVQANSVREVNGVIELVASDSVNLSSDSVIQAKGDSSGKSDGGSVTIQSAQSFVDHPGSVIDAGGGLNGGNGGQIELSASEMGAIYSTISARATPGSVSGKLFIDPANIQLSSSGDSAPSSGTVAPGDPPSSGTLTLNVNSFNDLITQNALSQINLQATKNIDLNTVWNLPDSQNSKATLTLTAGNSITLETGAGIDAGKNWSVNMSAGPQNLTTKPASGADGIYLKGNAFIETRNGNIDLWAANEVLVATGSKTLDLNNGIRTLAGGSVSVTTEFGNINSGGNQLGYIYSATAPYYSVSADTGLGQVLGGISTAAGGDVTIKAGGDVLSYLPVASSGLSGAADAGSGAFGPEPGNVTVTAGGSVFGHYVVANGVGSITAGKSIGGVVASQNVALSLMKGNWDLNAPNGNIYLQEVRNPNALFNSQGGATASGYHLFDYDPMASVDLNAGDGVYLTGLSLPRPSGAFQMVFPPTLDITAGAGGVVLQDNVTLFPSPYGNLQITTTGGGSLVTEPNNPGTLPMLLMSDSSKKQFIGTEPFGPRDHGTTPIELNNPNPVVINISGDVEDFTLITTKATQMTVGGDMRDSAFSGENLHDSDVTSINVAGQIFNRSPYSFITLGQAIPSIPVNDVPPGQSLTWDSIFSLAVSPAIAQLQVPPNLPASQWAAYAQQSAALFPANPAGISNPGFVYNTATSRLGFSGQMSPTILAALNQPLMVLRLDASGVPVTYTGPDGKTYFQTDRISWVNPTLVTALYTASQGAPSPVNPGLGFRIGGPGEFDVKADSISLGNAYGILSCGVGDVQGGFNRYADLAPYTKEGATLNVTVNGNLEMLTSTIASLGGGNVNVSSLNGALDLGSQELFSTRRELAFGVFTAGPGNVNVTALGDIDIDGSRIATYDGGNINVESLQGDVNAGTGGTTFVGVSRTYVNPATGQAAIYSELVFGSGIVANTLVNPSDVPGSATSPGNITVNTPRGDIIASLGGIVQEALNGNVSAGPTITLTAGTRASGTSPGYTGNIDLGESGVIGGTVNADANGNITGLVISRQNSTITAAQSFNGTVLSGGTANLVAGGTISGTVVGIGGVNASGAQGVSAALLGQNVSIGGGPAQSTLGSTATATVTSQAAAAQTSSDAKEQIAGVNPQDNDLNKKGLAPSLVRRTGRVTVLLPPNS